MTNIEHRRRAVDSKTGTVRIGKLLCCFEIERAHNNAVNAYGRWIASTPGTQTKEKLLQQYVKAETAFLAILHLFTTDLK